MSRTSVFEPLSSFMALIMIVCVAAGAWAPPARAVGPTNQLLTTPYVFNNADPQNLPKLRTNSIVQIDTNDGIGFPTGTRATGAVIQSRIINGVGYFCVLTADHVLNGTTTAKDFISFANSAAENQSSAPQYPVVRYARVPGDNGETVDLSVAVVRFGDPNDSLYTRTLDENIAAISVGGGRARTEIGFGRRTGQNDDGTTDPLVGVANTYGFKRYQNQKTTRTLNNFARTYNGAAYAYHSITYTFDAVGGANRVAGEGFGFAGDSGGPLLIDAEVNSANLNGQNNSIFTNFIAGVEAFGDNDTSKDPDGAGPLGVGEGAAVDAGYYNAKITTTCDALMDAVAVPGSSPAGMGILFAMLAGSGLLLLWRRRREVV
jgi:hypothetical protein